MDGLLNYVLRWNPFNISEKLLKLYARSNWLSGIKHTHNENREIWAFVFSLSLFNIPPNSSTKANMILTDEAIKTFKVQLQQSIIVCSERCLFYSVKWYLIIGLIQ
jgi:hypothetical protein